jgi:hypothetical protein
MTAAHVGPLITFSVFNLTRSRLLFDEALQTAVSVHRPRLTSVFPIPQSEAPDPTPLSVSITIATMPPPPPAKAPTTGGRTTRPVHGLNVGRDRTAGQAIKTTSRVTSPSQGRPYPSVDSDAE